MVIWYKLLNLILLVLYTSCFIKVKKNCYAFSPIFAFIVGVVYFLLLPFTILTFIGEFRLNPLSGAKGYWAYVNLNDSYYIYPYLVIWSTLFLCSLLILIFPLRPSLQKENNKLTISNTTFRKLVFIIILSMTFLLIDWGVKIIKFGGVLNYFELHWYMRNDLLFNKYGRLYVYSNKFAQTNMSIFSGASVLYTLVFFSKEFNKRKGTLILLILTFIFHLLIILLTGNRIYFALYLLLTFFGFLIYNYKKQLAFSILILPIFIIVFSAWAYTRSMLTNIDTAVENYIEGLKTLDNSIISMLFDVTEGANILVLFHIINDYGRVFDFLNGSTYFRVLTSFFPGFHTLDSFTVIVGNNYMPGTNVSLNSTIIGELYANFGKWSILLLPLICLFFIILSLSKKFNINHNPIFCFLMNIVICWFVRSIFSDNFILFIIATFIVLLESFLYNIFIKLSSSNQTKSRRANNIKSTCS